MLSSQLLYFWKVMKLSNIPGCILALYLLFANSVAVNAQDTWTLQRAVDYALANNIQIKQQDVQRRLAELTLKQSELQQVPTLNIGTEGAYGSGRNIDPYTNAIITQSNFNPGVGANAGATLFNWFYQRNTIASNKYQLKAQNSLLEKARNDVAFNVASSFLQILLNVEQVHISELQVKLTVSQLENTKKLVIAGSVPESNQADLEAKLASDSVALANAQNQVILSTLQVKALLNLGFEQPFVPQIPENISELPLPRLSEVDPEMVFSAALNTNPLIRADEQLIKATERSYAAARGQLYPRLSASANLNTNYANSAKNPTVVGLTPVSEEVGSVVVNGTTYSVTKDGVNPQLIYPTIPLGDQLSNNFRQSVGLSLSIPILNGWQARTNAQKAKVNILNQQLTRDADHLQLRQDIYTAHANAVAALQKFSASSKGVDASQRAYDFATKRFNLGLMNTIDYITTQSNLFRAQIDRVSAQYDYIFKMKLLEFYRDQKITL
jgi:outer membrane protein